MKSIDEIKRDNAPARGRGAGRKKQHVLQVRLDDDQLALISKCAAEHALDVSTWMRMIAWREASGVPAVVANERLPFLSRPAVNRFRSAEPLPQGAGPLSASQVTCTCHTCAGTGQRALMRIEWTTLEAVPFAFMSTQEIRGNMRPIKGSALSNRLVDLERLGLVEHRPGETDPRVKEWRRIR